MLSFAMIYTLVDLVPTEQIYCNFYIVFIFILNKYQYEFMRNGDFLIKVAYQKKKKMD